MYNNDKFAIPERRKEIITSAEVRLFHRKSHIGNSFYYPDTEINVTHFNNGPIINQRRALSAMLSGNTAIYGKIEILIRKAFGDDVNGRRKRFIS